MPCGGFAGVYSVRVYSAEEKVARDFLISYPHDCIINIIDGSNIERNLYLTLQLIELNKPMVLALNMMDEIRSNGGAVDVFELSNALGIPVVPISAAKNEGIDLLIKTAVETAERKITPQNDNFCRGALYNCIRSIDSIIETHAQKRDIPKRFATVKIIEDNDVIISQLNLSQTKIDLIRKIILEMEDKTGTDRQSALADMRYAFIDEVCGRAVVKPRESKQRKTTEKLDSIFTNKFLSFPVFFAIIILTLWLTFDGVGAVLSEMLNAALNGATNKVDSTLTVLKTQPIIHSLIIDGIFKGVGSVLSFLPIIITLFFFLSLLEDSGYMARVAFIMDKPMRKIGLSGRSVVPMIVGFGCSVPAIMATRTLSSQRDRKMTIMLTPFMSCSAKLPIYAVFASAFFDNNRSIIMILLYSMGVTAGIICGAALNNTRFSGSPEPFVMELPNYRLPSLKSVFLLMWDKAKDFITKAFTVIFVATVIIWFLRTFDVNFNLAQSGETSILAAIGKTVAPLFAPLGFSDWRAATALITGFTAKEAVVSTLSILTDADLTESASALSSVFPDVKSVFSFLTFTLLYTPCIAAVAAIRRELGSVKATAAVVIGQCVVAWAAAFFVGNPLILAIVIVVILLLNQIPRYAERK